MDTAQTQAEATARVAAIVRGLPNTALCALLGAAQWADEHGWLTEIARDAEAYDPILTAIEKAVAVCEQ